MSERFNLFGLIKMVKRKRKKKFGLIKIGKRKQKKKKDDNDVPKKRTVKEALERPIVLPKLKKYGKYLVPTKRLVIKIGKRK